MRVPPADTLAETASKRPPRNRHAGGGQHAYGRLALLHDPFGHGLCLLPFEGKGYDELPST
jgi:hypothetical protein